MTTFDIINDARLMELVRSARQKLIYVAPGVSAAVANALGQRFAQAGMIEVHVIVDVDPEVCRLGYGDLEALDLLKKMADAHQLFLRHQPGLRVGVVICDEQVIVYAPTPQLVEAGARSSDKPNAIHLGTEPLKAIESAVGAHSSGRLISDAEIGQAPVIQEQIQATREDLLQAPPQKFNLARQARVFSSRIQYIHLEAKGINLAQHKLRLPDDLVHADAQDELLDQLASTIRPIEGIKKLAVELALDESEHPIDEWPVRQTQIKSYTLERLREELKKLRDDHLHELPHYGTVLFTSTKQQFEKDAAAFRARLRAFLAKAREQLKALSMDQAQLVTDLVLRRLGAKTPTGMRPKNYPSGITHEAKKEYVRTRMEEAFDKAFSVEGSVSWRYMSIAPESMMDERFLEAVEAAIPEELSDTLFRRYDAAVASDKQDAGSKNS
jgi:hypothetical protein